MGDLLIRNGAILDGSGRDAFSADLGIKDGRIVAVAAGHGAGARRTIDARGLVVAPGFIDIKTHSDFTLPYAPRAESKVCQGVTTEVLGHCGFVDPATVADRATYEEPHRYPTGISTVIVNGTVVVIRGSIRVRGQAGYSVAALSVLPDRRRQIDLSPGEAGDLVGTRGRTTQQ